MSRVNLFLESALDSMKMHTSMNIKIGAKRDLLESVFGRMQMQQLEADIKNNRCAYLNKFGANVHFLSCGGCINDEILMFSVSGHHPGEALDTIKKMADHADGITVWLAAAA